MRSVINICNITSVIGIVLACRFLSQWMQMHSMRHLLGEQLGINAQTHTVEKCLQINSLTINTATHATRAGTLCASIMMRE